MSFGREVVDELRRRELMSHFLYADIQMLKRAADADAMRALLAVRGNEPGSERTEPWHFADFIEMRILEERLRKTRAAAVLFLIS